MLALQAARPGGQFGDRQATGGVDEQRGLLDLDGGVTDAAKFRGINLALAKPVGGYARGISQQTHGQLFSRHFEREEGDNTAIDGLATAVRLRLPSIGLGDVEGDIGGERCLTHRGATGEDQKVRGVQAAQLLVQIHQAGRHARQPAVTAIGLGGHLDGPAQGIGKVDKAGGGRAGLGQCIELSLCGLDMVAGGAVAVIGRRCNVAANSDQVAAKGQIIDHTGIVRRVGSRGRAVDQIGQIAQAAQLFKGWFALEPLHQHDGLGQHALADMFLDGSKQALVEGLEEVPRLKQVAQPLIGSVVIEQRTEKGLLGLDIGGHVGGPDVVGLGAAQIKGGNDVHA